MQGVTLRAWSTELTKIFLTASRSCSPIIFVFSSEFTWFAQLLWFYPFLVFYFKISRILLIFYEFAQFFKILLNFSDFRSVYWILLSLRICLVLNFLNQFFQILLSFKTHLLLSNFDHMLFWIILNSRSWT